MSEEAIRTGVYWLFGGPLMALGAWIGFFNIFRHWQMHRVRRRGGEQNISGVPVAASVFFLLGWWISPLPFSALAFLVLLAEPFAFITVTPAEEPSAPAWPRRPSRPILGYAPL